MDRTDRYIGRLFWSSYGIAFLFFFGAFVVMDLFGHADRFLDTAREEQIPGGRMLALVATYYLYASPSVFLQVAPFVTVIGVTVTMARLMQSNELIPILMSGRSVFRMLRPIFLYGGLLTVVMILIQELVAPTVGTKRIALYTYLNHGRRSFSFDMPIKDHQGNLWRRLRFDIHGDRILSASISRWDGERHAHAPEIPPCTYDSVRQGWVPEHPITWTVYQDGLEAQSHQVDFIPSTMDPRQIGALVKDAFDLSFRELGYLYSLTDASRYEVLLHYHITFPLTNILLILLALPFIIRYERGGMLLGLATAFIFCGMYFGVDLVMRSLGENRIHPILAAWFTPIFFGALGISLFDGIRT
jgi:lipopolysaccharide export LptBFGC system permease protein LptF